MSRILVSGATGFVGRAVVPRLAVDGHEIVTAGRSGAQFIVGDIGRDTDWSRALDGCDTVLHLAAQVPLRGVDHADFTRVNVAGTARLVADARAAGVTRFVFMSTIFAAIGETLAAGMVPDTPYGRSKRATEAHVGSFAGSGRQAVTLRPPLVYGEGVRGNFAALSRLAASPLPLPSAADRNRRSLIAVDNLVDAVAAVVRGAAGEGPSGTFAVSDAEPVSLAAIVSALRAGMGRSPGLMAIPLALIERPLRLAGMGRMADSLFGDLVADTSAFRAAFGWTPPTDTRAALTALGALLARNRASGQSRTEG